MSNLPYIWGMIEGGLIELVGINEQVTTGGYSESAAATLANGPLSGEILSIALYSTAVSALAPDLALYIFDQDPTITLNDVALLPGVLATVIGTVPIDSSEWLGDANSKVCFKSVSIPFHAGPSLYFAVLNTDALAINALAGDDDLLRLNFWYRRES